LPITIGTIAATCGSCRSARASSSVNGRTVFSIAPDAPIVVVRPGEICSRLVPNCVNSLSTNRCTPVPSAVSSTTAAMPTAIPSAVKIDRCRCPSTAEIANSMPSRHNTLSASTAPGPAEPRRTLRRSDAEADADEQCHGECQRRCPRRRAGQQFGHESRQQPRHQFAGEQTGAGADDRQQQRLPEEQPPDRCGPGAERLQQADLAAALHDRDDHHVHDQDAGDQEADRRDAGDRHGQRPQDAVEGRQHGFLRDHGHVRLALVAGGDRLFGVAHRLRHRGPAAGLEQDPEQAFAIEQGLRRGDRDHHHFVEVGAERETRRPQHANDPEPAVAEPHPLAKRGPAAEQFALQLHLAGEEVGHAAGVGSS
jgi:hypothetical protein